MCQDDNNLTPTGTSGHCAVWKEQEKLLKKDTARSLPLIGIGTYLDEDFFFKPQHNSASDKMFIPFFVVSHEITGLHHKVALPFSPHVHTIIPGYGCSYCSSTVSDLSHFIALKDGE